MKPNDYPCLEDVPLKGSHAPDPTAREIPGGSCAAQPKESVGVKSMQTTTFNTQNLDITNAKPAARVPSRPIYMVACLMLTDMVSLLLAVGTGVLFKYLAVGNVELGDYLRLWPFLFVFVGVYAAIGLYSGVALSPPEELRRFTVSSALLYLFLAALTVSLRGASHFFTWTLFIVIGTSVFLLPLMRAIVRVLYSDRSWWGYPSVVFGSGEEARSVINIMKRETGVGLKPIAVVDASTEETEIDGVPVVSPRNLATDLLRDGRFVYAVVADPEGLRSRTFATFERLGVEFSHVIVIPQMLDVSSLWVTPKSVGSLLGLEVCHQVLMQETQIAKRMVDLTLTVIGGTLLLPLFAAISLAIKLSSPGPVFYGQQRIGRGGRLFKAWKFRSMVTNADAVLKEHLAKSPELRAEWERDHKLKDDPRVTKIGAFLRKTSLDELPQIWNVLRDEMSLVGPRPIVHSEVVRYGAGFDMYLKVKSGLTGLWQVSGRSDTSYDERVRLDCFYVRNWSVWLDLCILFRTIGVVLLRKGAY